MDANEYSTVTISDIKCAYRSGGTGAPLLLLHGWGQSAEMWKNVLSELSRTYRVYALDLPGFGRSGTPRRAWDMGDYARFVKAFCGELNIERPFIVGHSFGGRVAYECASTFETGGIVLYSSSTLERRTLFRTIAKFATNAVGNIFPRLVWQIHTSALKPKSYTNVNEHSDDDIRVMLRTYKKTHHKPSITSAPSCRISLIYGSKDRLVPISAGKYYKTIHPDAALEVIEGAGHFAHIEQREEFLRTLSESIRSWNTSD